MTSELLLRLTITAVIVTGFARMVWPPKRIDPG